jgi:hypothetical protein
LHKLLLCGVHDLILQSWRLAVTKDGSHLESTEDFMAERVGFELWGPLATH